MPPAANAADQTDTIIPDERFVVRHPSLKDGDNWALHIKNLDRFTDSGLYQCQTNSEPPLSQFYQLNVVGKFRIHFHLTRLTCAPLITTNQNKQSPW